MNKKKILILGESGFIGRNLAEYFSKKDEYEVYGQYFTNAITRIDNITRIYANLTNKEDVEYLFNRVNPEIVLQYSAYTTNSKDVIEAAWKHCTDNYIINSLVLEATHRYGVKKFLYPSCSTMLKSSEIPQTETDWSFETIPTPYKMVASMKIGVERMCEAYSSFGKCKYSIIRQSNVFGKYDKVDLEKCHVFNAMVNKVVNAKDSIEVWGDPVNQAKRDLIYVDDVVNMVDLAIQKQETPYEIFNCGAGKAYSISEIIAMITSIENKQLKLIYNTSKPNIPTVTILNCQKAKDMLGWGPLVSFKTGVRETLEWYKKNAN